MLSFGIFDHLPVSIGNLTLPVLNLQYFLHSIIDKINKKKSSDFFKYSLIARKNLLHIMFGKFNNIRLYMLHVTVAIIAITLSCKETINTHKKKHKQKQKHYVKRVSYMSRGITYYSYKKSKLN